MLEILKLLRNNASQIRDFVGILFPLVATVLAILTYRRARFTLFQPLRAEVVKRQTDLLLELYDVLCSQQLGLVGSLDYINIVNANAYKSFLDLSLTKESENNKETFRDTISDSELWLDHVTIGFPSLFVDPPELSKGNVPPPSNRDSKLTPQELKKIIDSEHCIDIIYLTNDHVSTINKIQRIIANPITPKEVVSQLEKLKHEIGKNLSVILPSILEAAIKESCTQNLLKQKVTMMDYRAISNGFLANANTHKESSAELQLCIRKLLRVDSNY